MKRTVTLLILFLALKGISQDKKNILRIGLRLFKESDAAFSFKRKLPKNEYVYNLGFGLRARYSRILVKRLSIGPEIGVWYFINNAKNIDLYNNEYTRRNLVVPFMFCVHINIFQKDKNWISLGLKGGTVYLQNIRKLDNNITKTAGTWTSIFEVSLTAQFVTNGVRKRVYHLGYGWDFFDNKVIRGAYIDFIQRRF
ncbi:MAG: hypothetical protein JNL60_07445 [Bacteroidia bacterium]|nr:hypothetical protein [Bacteroidia bacterium]